MCTPNLILLHRYIETAIIFCSLTCSHITFFIFLDAELDEMSFNDQQNKARLTLYEHSDLAWADIRTNILSVFKDAYYNPLRTTVEGNKMSHLS